jgi:uncharacterized protein YaiE (UPF0345 family)
MVKSNVFKDGKVASMATPDFNSSNSGDIKVGSMTVEATAAGEGEFIFTNGFDEIYSQSENKYTIQNKSSDNVDTAGLAIECNTD